MPLLVWKRLAQRLLPDDLAAGSTDRQRDKLMAMCDREIVVIARRAAGPRRQRLSKRNRRGQKHAVAPDDRRGMPAAGNLRFPADVFAVGFAPNQRRIGIRRNTRRQRPAPLPPVIGALTSLVRARPPREPTTRTLRQGEHIATPACAILLRGKTTNGQLWLCWAAQSGDRPQLELTRRRAR